MADEVAFQEQIALIALALRRVDLPMLTWARRREMCLRRLDRLLDRFDAAERWRALYA